MSKSIRQLLLAPDACQPGPGVPVSSRCSVPRKLGDWAGMRGVSVPFLGHSPLETCLGAGVAAGAAGTGRRAEWLQFRGGFAAIRTSQKINGVRNVFCPRLT